MVWKRPSIRIQFQKSMSPSANRFQHHFKLRSIYKHPCVSLRSWHSLKWMFITIRKRFLQQSASSLWKLCKISSNVKTKFQISRWSYFVYVMVLLSKGYGNPWRMCAKSYFMELYSKMYITLLRSFWYNMDFPSCRRHYFGNYPLQKWWKRSIKKSAQLVHVE